MDIHFCDEDGRPLCLAAEGDGWLWTSDPQDLTCTACGALLPRTGGGFAVPGIAREPFAAEGPTVEES